MSRPKIKENDWMPHLPARIDCEQTAKVLGFQEHDVRVLVQHGLLTPLGKPMPNARKYFARVYIFQIGEDLAWLAKATKALYQHWQDKNANRKTSEENNELSHSE